MMPAGIQKKLRIGMQMAPSVAVYFAIDLSGSMHYVGGNGRSRLDNMKTALNAALDQLGSPSPAAPQWTSCWLSGDALDHRQTPYGATVPHRALLS
ncbi:hypothetical protein [Xylella fastidiosa]|uniref:hypothetical protein n=1 Tax=Xylella fastidiosa TaxID=2371 RepID=UPI003AFA4E53